MVAGHIMLQVSMSVSTCAQYWIKLILGIQSTPKLVTSFLSTVIFSLLETYRAMQKKPGNISAKLQLYAVTYDNNMNDKCMQSRTLTCCKYCR